MVSPKVGIWLLGKSFLRKAGYFFRRLDALAQRHNQYHKVYNAGNLFTLMQRAMAGAASSKNF
jgi:hypothetical protein